MRSLASGRRETSEDVGTLWTMRRSGLQARCALIALVGEWEPRIIVEGNIVLAQRCPRGAEAFALADAWKRRMFDEGWRQVVPDATLAPAAAAQAPGAVRTAPFLATRFV